MFKVYFVFRDDLREHLKNAQKLIMAQRQEVSSSDTNSSSGEEEEESSEESSSSSGEEEEEEESSESESSESSEEERKRYIQKGVKHYVFVFGRCVERGGGGGKDITYLPFTRTSLFWEDPPLIQTQDSVSSHW